MADLTILAFAAGHRNGKCLAAAGTALVGRVVVDDDAATQYYTVANVLGGWDPHTEAW